MKFNSYMNDYHDTYVCGKDDARATGKGIFFGFGVCNLLLGLFCIPYTFIGALIGIIGGIALLLYAFIYFRKI